MGDGNDSQDGTQQKPTVPGAPEVKPGQETPVVSLADVQAELARTKAHNASLTSDLGKIRDWKREQEDATKKAQTEHEQKLRDAGETGKLLDIEKTKRMELEKQLAQVSPNVERYSALEQKLKKRIDDAKAKGDLPTFIVKALDSATNLADATEILDEYRAAGPSGESKKQAAEPVTTPGGPPQSKPGQKPVQSMTAAELDAFNRADPDAFRKATGGKTNGNTGGITGWLRGLGG